MLCKVIGDILQPSHLLFVLVVALLVLGPKRLPEVGRSLGRGLRDFRGALSGDDHDERPLPNPTQYTPAQPSEPTYQPPAFDPPPPGAQPTDPAAQAPKPAADEPAASVQHAHPGEAIEEPANAEPAQHTH